MADCPFCNIIEGAIPSAKVYEDDVCYAFDDIAPEAPRSYCLLFPSSISLHSMMVFQADLLGQLTGSRA